MCIIVVTSASTWIKKGSAVMLTSIQSAGVAPEVNLRITQARKHTKRDPPSIETQDATRSPKQGYQWPNEKDLRLPKIYKKNKNYGLFSSCFFPLADKGGLIWPSLCTWLCCIQYSNMVVFSIAQKLAKKMNVNSANFVNVTTKSVIVFTSERKKAATYICKCTMYQCEHCTCKQYAE